MTVYLARQAISIWEAEVTNWGQLETGGVILGYETVSGDLVITDCTAPGPRARRNWFRFEPDDEWDKRIIAKVYEASGRVVRYLGEWHSHPLGSLRPSHDDVRTMRLVAAYELARIDNPLGVIVARWPVGVLRWAVYQLNETGQLERVSPTIISWASRN